jgi:NAD-dependent deacetylase
VFFGESICNHAAARSVLWRADILVVVGTSLAVDPAASFAMESPARTIYVVDPAPARATWEDRVIRVIRKPAAAGVPEAITRVLAGTS